MHTTSGLNLRDIAEGSSYLEFSAAVSHLSLSLSLSPLNEPRRTVSRIYGNALGKGRLAMAGKLVIKCAQEGRWLLAETTTTTSDTS